MDQRWLNGDWHWARNALKCKSSPWLFAVALHCDFFHDGGEFCTRHDPSTDFGAGAGARRDEGQSHLDSILSLQRRFSNSASPYGRDGGHDWISVRLSHHSGSRPGCWFDLCLDITQVAIMKSILKKRLKFKRGDDQSQGMGSAYPHSPGREASGSHLPGFLREVGIKRISISAILLVILLLSGAFILLLNLLLTG